MGIKVAFFPNPYISPPEENPYLARLSKALEKHGVKVVKDNPRLLHPKWLWMNRGAVDVLHFHWIGYHYYIPGRGSLLLTMAALLYFFSGLSLAKVLGYKLIWTIHQFSPHEGKYFLLDHLARVMMIRAVAAVIVHCQYAKSVLTNKFGRKENIFVISLANYDFYPNTVSKSEARERLNIPINDFVYLFLGQIRPNKGVEQLIHKFFELGERGSTLMIAGRPVDGLIERKIVCLAEGNPGIRLFLQFIPAEELQLYFKAADVVVLPFQDILTSSSLMLALSFGRPVIAPAIGCIPEVLTPSTGILYNPADKEGLLQALQQCKNLDLHIMGEAAFEIARQFTWKEMAVGTLKAYMA